MALAYLCARVISAVVNYTINSVLIFKKPSVASFLKYAVVAASVATLGSLGSNLLNGVWNIPAWLCKVLVDLPLWLVSFFTQKYVVFRKNKNATDRSDPKAK